MQDKKSSLLIIGFLMAAMGTGFGQPAGTRLWEFSASGRVNSSPAIGADGTIYFGGGTNLYALTAEGRRKWQFGAGGPIYASPLIALDGTIYFGAFDHRLYALSPNGRLKWSFPTRDRIYSSAAMGMDGTIYFGADDTLLYALNPDGALKWTFATGSYVRSSPAVGADGTIYVGSWDSHLYAVTPEGALKWAFPAGHYVYSSPAIGVDGTIYVGSVDDRLYALNPDGTKKWEFPTASHIYSSPCIGADGTIYFGSWDSRLYALSPAGTQKWAFATANLVQSSPAVGADGSIYFGSDENKLYALNADGTKQWTLTTGSLVRSSPALAPDGTVYIGSEDYKLYAIKGAGGLAVSPWPRFRSDLRHRGKVLLIITRQPQSQMIVVSNTASFSASASGAGPLSYQWRLNGTNVAGETAPSLTLSNVQPAQMGDYTLEVSNAVETVTSAPAALTVVVRPALTLQPQSQTVTVGTNVAFKVAASSVAPLTYQWFFNGTNLSGAIAPDLLLPSVQLTNAGNYSVIVSNAAGASPSAPAVLTVVIPPQIVVQPQNQVVVAGTNVTLSVMANSLAPMTYRWRLNGTNLAGANATNLVLQKVQATNAGTYTAEVSNMAGAVISAPATLTVVLPPEITQPPKSLTGIRGRPAGMEVTAVSAGPASYQWFFNGTPLAGATGSSYKLPTVHPTNAGTYRVVVTNLAGAVTSPPAMLTVLTPPAIITQPQSQTGLLGRDISFNVRARGSSPLHFVWQFKGTNIPGGTNSLMQLNQLTEDHAGLYRVVITNFAGSITSQTATLSIPPPPTLWQRIKGWF